MSLWTFYCHWYPALSFWSERMQGVILFFLYFLRFTLWSVLEKIPWLLRRMCIRCLGGIFCKYPFGLTLELLMCLCPVLTSVLMWEWDVRSSPRSARARFNYWAQEQTSRVRELFLKALRSLGKAHMVVQVLLRWQGLVSSGSGQGHVEEVHSTQVLREQGWDLWPVTVCQGTGVLRQWGWGPFLGVTCMVPRWSCSWNGGHALGWATRCSPTYLFYMCMKAHASECGFRGSFQKSVFSTMCVPGMELMLSGLVPEPSAAEPFCEPNFQFFLREKKNSRMKILCFEIPKC